MTYAESSENDSFSPSGLVRSGSRNRYEVLEKGHFVLSWDSLLEGYNLCQVEKYMLRSIRVIAEFVK